MLSSGSITEQDLTGLLTSPMVQHSEVFDEALRLVTSLQSSPSCTRLAASTLLLSCQSITGPSKDAGHSSLDSEAALDDLKSSYAARLAVCELVGAGTAVPNYCAPLMASDQAKSKQGFRAFLKYGSGQRRATDMDYDTVTGIQLGQCLKSLESRPQWWTSYSNNRQNAVVMCQAARAQIEKGERDRSKVRLSIAKAKTCVDEMLGLHKSMTEVNSEMNSVLAKSLDDAHLQLKDQARFSEAVKAFQTTLLRDLKISNTEAQTYFRQLIERVDTAMHVVLAKITTAAKVVESDVQGLSRVSSFVLPAYLV